MTRKTEKLEPYDATRTCASCSHMHGECEMYRSPGIVIAFNHRLVRCNWFERRIVEDSVEPDFDERGLSRDEWKHQAALWQRLK